MNEQDVDQETRTFFWPQTALHHAEFVLKVILIVASVGAFVQYCEIRQENRVKQTMEQLKSFNSGRLQKAYLNLNSIWFGYYSSIEDINKETIKRKDDVAQIKANIILPIITKKELQQDIRLLVDFYENLQVCVQNQICDKQVARDFFGDYADNFYCWHLPWIKKQRTGIPDYAKHLLAFAHSKCR